MPEASTASSSPSKPSLLPQIPATTEPPISQQNALQLKEALMLQLDQQMILHEKLEQQRDLILKNSGNDLSIDGVNSTRQMQMVQSKQQMVQMLEASTASSSPSKPSPSPQIPATTEPSITQQIPSQLMEALTLQLEQQMMLNEKFEQQRDLILKNSSNNLSGVPEFQDRNIPVPRPDEMWRNYNVDKFIMRHQQQSEIDGVNSTRQMQMVQSKQQMVQMPEASTASSSPPKPSPSPQIPATTEPSILQQNAFQLKESLKLQLDEQRILHEKLEQQRDLILKNSSNDLSDVPNFEGLRRNIPMPRPDEMRRSYNGNKFIMRHHQQRKSEIGGINSTLPMQMVQSKQQMVQMPEASTASSSPSKPSPLPQIPATTEPSITQQNAFQLKEALTLQLDQQMMLHEKLEQQRDLILKNSSNNLSGVLDFQDLRRNIPVPRPDEKRRSYNVNKFIMRHQQQRKSEIDGVNSTQQMQMVQSEQKMVQRLQQQTGSHNLTSQAQNALTSGLTQNGQSGVIQNATSPHPWFKQMQVIDPIYSSSQLQQQSQRMEGPADQKSVFLTGSQPDDATPGGSSSNGTEANDQFIRKRMIHDVISQLDLNGNLDPEFEELLVKIAGYAIDSVTALTRTPAKHPKSSTTDSKDELLHPGGSKQESSKSSVRKPKAVYCHCGLEATTHTSNQGTRFWSCNKLGAQRCGFFRRCDPEMCSGCIETLSGFLARMDAKDATIKELKSRYRELNMATLFCVLVMQLMLLYRFFIE